MLDHHLSALYWAATYGLSLVDTVTAMSSDMYNDLEIRSATSIAMGGRIVITTSTYS